ncbi:MAG TPA: ABC transporter ATP-binding protein [Candidatus Dormibacteraeota bacterium]|jgi:ABC-2 type transport system ATP-binding protein|nr:ABC transporter ATP-binding protein [Candidatus Dormibacteraeota bacterium]
MTQAADHVVATHALTKRYGKNIMAVDALDLEVRRGEVFGFLGPNGAGKTTTLRMLLGLIRPTSGSAQVVGRRPGDPAGLARVGSLVESPAFYPYLSGRENLKVVADYAGLPHDRVDGALAEVELLPRAKDRFGTYSMGMKQRLAVAAALIKEPELMILDEPTNGLDPQGVVEMRTLIRRLGTGSRTVLLSSHLLNEVEQTCDRVAIIQKGKLVVQGRVDELRGQATLIVKATPSDAARQSLERMLGKAAVAGADGTLRLSVSPDRAADINAALVSAGIRVSELRPAERTLEEVFLSLTGEAA